MYENHFCLILKSQGVSFNKAIEEMRLSSEVVDNIISDKRVESFIKNEYKPKRVQSQLTNMIVSDIEKFSSDRAFAFPNCKNGISKISGKF